MSELTVILDNFSATLLPLFVNLAWQFALLAGCVWVVVKAGWIRSTPTQHMLWVMCVFSPILLICLGVLMPNASILIHEKPSSTGVEDSASFNRSESVSYQRIYEEPRVDSTPQPTDPQDNVTISSYAENNNLSETQPHPPTITTPLAKSDDGIREAFAGWLSHAPLMVGLLWLAGFGLSLLRLGWGCSVCANSEKARSPSLQAPFWNCWQPSKLAWMFVVL